MTPVARLVSVASLAVISLSCSIEQPAVEPVAQLAQAPGLEQACRDHSPDLPRTLRDPAFDALRGSARFHRVRDCVGLRADGDLDPARVSS